MAKQTKSTTKSTKKEENVETQHLKIYTGIFKDEPLGSNKIQIFPVTTPYQYYMNKYNNEKGNKDKVAPQYQNMVTSFTVSLDKRTGKPKTGLEIGEKVYLFQKLLGINDYGDNKGYFNEQIDEWYYNVNVRVSSTGGIELEIGFKEIEFETTVDRDGKIITEKSYKKEPINFKDYIIYRFIKEKKNVAKDMTLINIKHEYYVHNEDSMTDKRIEEIKLRRKANEQYLALEKEDYSLYIHLFKDKGVAALKTDNVTELCLDEGATLMKMDDLVKSYPEVFLSIHEDNNKKNKLKLFKYVLAGCLDKTGEKYYHGETTIGDELAALRWMSNPVNKQFLISFNKQVSQYETSIQDQYHKKVQDLYNPNSNRINLD